MIHQSDDCVRNLRGYSIGCYLFDLIALLEYSETCYLCINTILGLRQISGYSAMDSMLAFMHQRTRYCLFVINVCRIRYQQYLCYNLYLVTSTDMFVLDRYVVAFAYRVCRRLSDMRLCRHAYASVCARASWIMHLFTVCCWIVVAFVRIAAVLPLRLVMLC